MTNEELKKKIINIIHDTEICPVENDCADCKYRQELMNYKDMSCRTLRAVDNLIAAGIGDVKEAEHRAKVAEKAFLILWNECKEKLGWDIDCTMWYKKQAEKELKLIHNDKEVT